MYPSLDELHHIADIDPLEIQWEALEMIPNARAELEDAFRDVLERLEGMERVYSRIITGDLPADIPASMSSSAVVDEAVRMLAQELIYAYQLRNLKTCYDLIESITAISSS